MCVCIYIYRYIRIDIYTCMAVLHFAVCCSPWSDNIDRCSHAHIRAHIHAACKRSDQVCRRCQGLQILHSGWYMHAYRVAKTHRMPHHFSQKSPIGHLPHKSPRIIGSFSKRDLLLGALQAEGRLRPGSTARHGCRTTIPTDCEPKTDVQFEIEQETCNDVRFQNEEMSDLKKSAKNEEKTGTSHVCFCETSNVRLKRPISKKDVKRGQQVVARSVGSAVRLLWRAASSGAKAPPLAARLGTYVSSPPCNTRVNMCALAWVCLCLFLCMHIAVCFMYVCFSCIYVHVYMYVLFLGAHVGVCFMCVCVLCIYVHVYTYVLFLYMHVGVSFMYICIYVHVYMYVHRCQGLQVPHSRIQIYA